MRLDIVIALALFAGSILGLLYFSIQKIPLLLGLASERQEFLRGVRGRIANGKIAKFVSSPEMFLQALLSKIRIFALKIEGKSADWLMRLRKKSQEKNGAQKFSETYWDKLKK
ncbi:MAG: hypothetical protein HYS52_01915 [Candidatus Wildermuthbacteria bacterium]|nr:hypothetical protein [Candidatus Wildermuthbacteria bacterium]